MSGQVLFVKPGAISKADKTRCSKLGIAVVEIENPQDAKLIQAHGELDSGALMVAAAKAIKASGGLTSGTFGAHVAEAVIEQERRRLAEESQ